MTRSPQLIHRTVTARAGEPPHPLLLLLHGRGADELDLLGLAPHLDSRFFVVSARAPFDWPGQGYCWVVPDDGGPGQSERSSFQASLARLAGLVRDLAAAYPIDAERVFLLGFSQGALMANALTLTAPQLVAGAVLLSGSQPNLDGLAVRHELLTRKPILVAHGTLDPLLGIERGRAVRAALEGLGVDLTYREYEIGHQIVGPELFEVAIWLRERLDDETRR